MITPSAQRPTILIVDDQEENLRVVGSVLSIMGYDIVPATSAEQALKRLSARKVDLVLMDMFMPGVDGLEACRQIKMNPQYEGIPVIFLSASDDKNTIVQALEAGGVDYVTKPFNRAELLSRVRTQLTLKESRDQLHNLAEDKDELLGILAHDLKNGLAGIQLSSSLLQERADELPKRCATLVDNIANTTDRLLSYMREFLANQLAEHLSLEPQSVSLADLVRSVVASHESAAASKNMELKVQVQGEAPSVKADPEALRQVIENIVSNAIKFTPESGTVVISLPTPSLGRAQVVVSDSGPGFSPDDRGKIFSRYARLSARPTGNEPSTGLGLSIVKKLLTGMGGDIILSPNAGTEGGAEFTLTLPLASAEPQES
jgi:two-component system sensor histidine kinase/response regulator